MNEDSETYVKIKLDRTYYILSDYRQWILAKKNHAYDSKNSKSREFLHDSYYSNIQNLLKSYLMLRARLCNAKTLEELNNTLRIVAESLQGLNSDIIEVNVTIKGKGRE